MRHDPGRRSLSTATVSSSTRAIPIEPTLTFAGLCGKLGPNSEIRDPNISVRHGAPPAKAQGQTHVRRIARAPGTTRGNNLSPPTAMIGTVFANATGRRKLIVRQLSAGGSRIRTLSLSPGLLGFLRLSSPSGGSKWTPYWITFGLRPTRINRQPGEVKPAATMGCPRIRSAGFLCRTGASANQDFRQISLPLRDQRVTLAVRWDRNSPQKRYTRANRLGAKLYRRSRFCPDRCSQEAHGRARPLQPPSTAQSADRPHADAARS